MTQADSVHSTPPLNTSPNNPLGLARQQRERERALRRIAKLRRKASDEIDRLLAFLDASDPYVSTEREQEDEGDGDCDLEDGADDEPSLGSHEIREAGAVSYLHHYVSDGGDMLADCELDDCDREDDDPEEAKQQPAEAMSCA